MNIHGYGYYQCYCEKYSSSFKLWSKDATSIFCQPYNHDQAVGKLLANSVAVLISVINIVLRTVNTKLIEYIGYPSVSRRTMNVMEAVFVTSFINTGIILLFTNADLRYSVLSFIPINAQYPDIGQNWYLDISSALARTMLVMAVFPYIEFAIGFTMKTVFRLLDSGCFCCRKGRAKFRTKKVTLQQYINLYAGPDYIIHFKYASIIVQVYVSFMYGMFVPILYPIALFGIFNMYVIERLCLAYFYKQPPMYDSKLNGKALQVLQYAPCLMYIFGYWALSNQQIFFGVATERQSQNVSVDPQHKLLDLK